VCSTEGLAIRLAIRLAMLLLMGMGTDPTRPTAGMEPTGRLSASCLLPTKCIPSSAASSAFGVGQAMPMSVQLVPWGDDTAEQTRDGLEPSTERPWPGALPPPMPTTVHMPPLPADLRTYEGWPVKVSRRGLIDAAPARLSIARSSMGSLGPSVTITSWAGPWPVEERWWDPATARRRARMQVVTADGQAHVLSLEGGNWWLEATYLLRSAFAARDCTDIELF
jgi:hypothetical protein